MVAISFSPGSFERNDNLICSQLRIISASVNEDCDLLITVKDSGSGFDPSRIVDPTAAANVLADHGRGIFLIRQFMDQVDFEFDNGTEVRMRKRSSG